MEFKNVLSPYPIGGVTLKNRFVVPALGSNYGSEDGYVTEQLIDYYVERAKGGFGLIVIEVCAVSPNGKAIPNQLGIWDDSFIPGFRRLVDALHQYGAKVAIQLHHAGRQADPATLGGKAPVAPSALSCPLRKTLPHELTTAEAYELIDAFVQAGRRVYQAGADFVELNGAHGYLIAQFMSQYSNKRIDAFGGTLESRMRFPLEIIRGIRGISGCGLPIIFRMCGDEMVEGGRRILDTEMIAGMLEDAGVSALSISMGVYSSLQYMSAPAAVPPGYITELSKAVKQVVGIPVIVAGRINSPQLAESIIRNGKADLVALGRVSLADPEFPAKVASGRTEEIAPCVGCLNGCIGYLFDPNIKKISCMMNPFAGKEREMEIRPAAAPKKIIVVGAGPAGMEFSWIAAKRGHKVICLEKTPYVGGQLRLGGIPPAKDEMLGAVKYFKRMCDKYGVEFRMECEATEELIVAERPDAVVLATGAVALRPDIPGIHNESIVEADDMLAGKCIPGEKALVVGGGQVGCETALFLAERGAQVSVVELKPEVAADDQPFARVFLMESMRNNHVEIITNARVQRFLEDGVAYESIKMANGIASSSVKTLSGFDTVVLAMGRCSHNPLESVLKAKGLQVHTIGDAASVGKAIDAVAQAAACAVEI